jgi:regulatory protein YycH of two-component signal transduction system YycFG
MKKVKLTLGLLLSAVIGYLIWKPKNTIEKVSEKNGYQTKEETN